MTDPNTDVISIRPDARSEISSAVGTSVSRLRAHASITLRELGKKSGVSPAMISRIENGQVSPSLSTLEALAAALDVPVIAFFQHTVHHAEIAFARAGEGLESKSVLPNHSQAYRLLGSFANTEMRFSAVRITRKRSDNGNHPLFHDAGYMLVTVLEGNCVYTCGESTYDMGPGDTLTFDAQLRHGVKSCESETVAYMVVVAEPA
ncbi:helix-turn-helix domain-containing protein [Albidovulum sediminicola]|uniref:Helix-turn-helix domain-containing protein n=1 Tax=Albidovulum sediminicola TaxID=2984331 RepID=A0ABT2Z1H0_9RHOB|nr:helix-turn-helix domain-containing protein [Defluviimonas sp. WL0075]MCV2864601.1 helix-turn-helix domain-containing protein [Defluviimonas sp. WL0075]